MKSLIFYVNQFFFSEKRIQKSLFYMYKQIRKKIFQGSQVNEQKKYQFKLAFGSAPHPQKVWKGGQDALFVSKNILVMADGVGGWSKMGIDSGTYARQLIAQIKQLIQNEKQLYYIQRPQQLAIRAVQKNNQKGSSTLSIITLHPQTGMLRSYVIGDTVYGIFRKEGQTFIAQQQQRSFNVPFQVFGGNNNVLKTEDNSSDQEEQQPVSDVFKGSYNQFSYRQLLDSTILLASDGLWDNLQLFNIQKQLFGSEISLVQKVKSLVKKAKQNSKKQQFESPFYLKAIKQGQKVPKCGKVDDITIILAQVLYQ